MTLLINNAVVANKDGWTNGNISTGQQYSGAPDNAYLDFYQVTKDIYQTIKDLPAGIYELTAATRTSKTVAVGYIYATTNGVKKTADTEKEGNTGNVLGNGWGWTTLSDIQVINGEMTIGLYAECGTDQWVGADNFQLTMVRAYTDAEVAQLKLPVAIEAAKAVDVTTNVGDAGFQIPTSAADALKAAILTAEGIAATPDLSADEYVAAATALNDAVETFKATEPNAPAADEAFRIVLDKTSSSRHGLALNARQDRNNMGNWNLGSTYAPNDYMLQAFFFTPTANKNEYKIYFVDAEGVKHYFCVGAVYSGGFNDQIRTTEDLEQALAIRVDATSTRGVYNLYNTVYGANIGVDPGFFTTRSDNTYNLIPCPKTDIKLTVTEAEYATIMLPFAAELPTGVEAFTCDAAAETVDGIRVLTLNPATKFEANVPYIVKGTAGTEETLSGYGVYYVASGSYAVSLTSGWLTGVYTSQAAPVGSYVLQNGEAGVGFYAVASGSQPTMGAYRAYLTAEDAAGIRGFIFAEGDATGIEGVTAEDGKLIDVYTISGTLVRSQVAASKALRGLGKGIYVVGGEKKVVK